MSWYLEVLKKYAVFSGRARRTEYWMFVLINFIIGLILGGVDFMLGFSGLVGSIYSLAVFIPGLAVSVRRLHDTNRSGWWLFVFLIPLVGWIILLIFMIQDSIPGENKYGPNPKANNSNEPNQKKSQSKPFNPRDVTITEDDVII